MPALVIPTASAMSLMEVWAAGRSAELGLHERILRTEYDLVIFPIDDLQWFGRPLWEELQGRYRAFFTTEGEAEGDFWYHGWQGFSSRPVVFFERESEKGRHEVSEEGKRCERR